MSHLQPDRAFQELAEGASLPGFRPLEAANAGFLAAKAGQIDLNSCFYAFFELLPALKAGVMLKKQQLQLLGLPAGARK